MMRQAVRRAGVSLLLGSVLLLAAAALLPGAEGQTRFMYLRGQSIHPAFEGWWPNDDGSFTLWFGYMNSNWSPPYILPEPPPGNRWTTDVTFDRPGGYVLRAVASDGSRFTYADVTVHVTR